MSKRESKKEKNVDSKHERNKDLHEAIDDTKKQTQKNVAKANERGDQINEIDKKSLSILEKARLYRKTAHKTKK